jgi:DNA-binding FadR family transcriptional regulator
VLIWHAEAGFSREFLSALGEMRLALEPQAASLAADRRSERQLATLDACIERMAAPGVSKEDFVAADLDFHLAVAGAAGNPFLAAVSTLIEVALVAALARSWPGSEPDGTANSAAKHRAIAEAIRRGNGRLAATAMRAVIEEGIGRTASLTAEQAG